jgi:hypothetical protein
MRSLLVGVIAIVGMSCAGVQGRDEEAGEPVSVKEFWRDRQTKMGATVSVQGYLVVIDPDLALYADERLPSVGDSPIVFVEDLKLRKERRGLIGPALGEAGFLREAGCTDKYALVVGVAGMTVRDVVGIKSILSVDTYDFSDFSGEPVRCYARD